MVYLFASTDNCGDDIDPMILTPIRAKVSGRRKKLKFFSYVLYFLRSPSANGATPNRIIGFRTL